MALIKTDWTKELEQVEATCNKLLDERIEPMVERNLERGVNEVSLVMDKASFEIQDAIKQLREEVDRQRQQAVADARQLIIFLLGGLALLMIGFFVLNYLLGVG
jgi:CHASE3 domain sensor protein